MNSKNLPLSRLEGGWIAELGWTRKLVIVGGMLNIIALLLVILSVLHFTPVTLLASVSISGVLMGIAIIIYIIIVIADLRRRGVI